MKYLKPFNEAKKWTLDELFDAMKHPFLERSFVIDIFSDVIVLGYSLGFKGYYNHDWIFPDGYNTISNDNLNLFGIHLYTAINSDVTYPKIKCPEERKIIDDIRAKFKKNSI
jgi:hypothetical protein